MDLTGTVTLSAVAKAVGRLGSLSITLSTGDVGGQFHLFGGSVEGFQESDVHSHAKVSSSCGSAAALASTTTSSHTAEDGVEDIAESAAETTSEATATTWMTLIDSGSNSKTVVVGAFLFVTEDGVGLIDFTELLLGFLFVLGHVGMVLASHPLEGTLDLFLVGVLGNTEDIVIVATHSYRTIYNRADGRRSIYKVLECVDRTIRPC